MLLVNGVDVVPLVDAELNRCFPGRELRDGGRQRPGHRPVVESISHSKFWKDSAIFVVDDDSR